MMHELGDLFVCAVAAICVWIYRREAHFAWAAQGRAVLRAMEAEDELADIRAAFSDRSRRAAATRRRLKQQAEDVAQPKITALHFEN